MYYILYVVLPNTSNLWPVTHCRPRSEGETIGVLCRVLTSLKNTLAARRVRLLPVSSRPSILIVSSSKRKKGLPGQSSGRPRSFPDPTLLWGGGRENVFRRKLRPLDLFGTIFRNMSRSIQLKQMGLPSAVLEFAFQSVEESRRGHHVASVVPFLPVWCSFLLFAWKGWSKMPPVWTRRQLLIHPWVLHFCGPCAVGHFLLHQSLLR